MKKKCSTEWCVILLVISCLTAGASEKPVMKRVAEFGGPNLDAQLLHDGHVVTYDDEDKSFKEYKFNGASFVETRLQQSAEAKHWTSFDWKGVDYLDQIDRKDYPISAKLLPPGAKVKKTLNTHSFSHADLFLLCYTLKSTEKSALPDATDIFVVAVVNKEPDSKKPKNFQKLWTLKLQPESNYGQFEQQSIPGVGDFILLYSASVGGNSVDQTLDIYQIVE